MSTIKTRLLDVGALFWMLALTVIYLSPAFKDGSDFGPGDIGANMSLLTSGTFHGAYFNNLDSDIITQYQPWTIFDWNEVHHGVFPMWNYLVGTGLPQFLNFQSSPLSLPSLVGYAFPVDESLLVGVAVKMFVAGTGVYVTGRLLRLSPLPSAFAATTFMLSGSFSGWLGWSISGPLSWSGWILAGCILAYRRWAHGGTVALLALAIAFSVYAGFPEASLLLALGVGSVLLGSAAALSARRALSLVGCARVGAGGLVGIALSAPLLLPGADVLQESARAASHQGSGLSIDLSSLLLARGYYGLPLRGSPTWTNYYETTAYVGALALVFVAVAALAAGSVATFLVVYRPGRAGPVQWLLDHLGFRQVAFQRMLPFLALCVSLLAGIGLEHARSHWERRCTRRYVLGATALVGLAVGLLWLLAATMGEPSPRPLLGKTVVPLSILRSVRESSLVWPTVEIGALGSLLVVGALVLRSERSARWGRSVGAPAILVVQAAFLLVAGIGL
ncbi:MAG: hypothetical protein L3K17_10575, partial [Thermoplasmata archaeon]|nr:hypothetical protein [Thermoplasmata archaeon]